MSRYGWGGGLGESWGRQLENRVGPNAAAVMMIVTMVMSSTVMQITIDHPSSSPILWRRKSRSRTRRHLGERWAALRGWPLTWGWWWLSSWWCGFNNNLTILILPAPSRALYIIKTTHFHSAHPHCVTKKGLKQLTQHVCQSNAAPNVMINFWRHLTYFPNTHHHAKYSLVKG